MGEGPATTSAHSAGLDATLVSGLGDMAVHPTIAAGLEATLVSGLGDMAALTTIAAGLDVVTPASDVAGAPARRGCCSARGRAVNWA